MKQYLQEGVYLLPIRSGNNRDRNATFRVVNAVAFGDFLSDRSRVQDADVGNRAITTAREPSRSGWLLADSIWTNFSLAIPGRLPPRPTILLLS